jgi:hypothetical protein
MAYAAVQTIASISAHSHAQPESRRALLDWLSVDRRSLKPEASSGQRRVPDWRVALGCLPTLAPSSQNYHWLHWIASGLKVP